VLIPIHTSKLKVFYALCVVDFLLRLEWGISTSMMTLYIHELGGSPFEVSLVFSVFAGISILCYSFWGSFSDNIGKRKRFIIFGMAGLLPIYLLIATQQNILLLILLRGSTAIFKGAVVPTLYALVTDISPPQYVGTNIGILGSVEMAGWAIGPVIGGLLADSYGFPLLWVFVGISCFVGALLFLVGGDDPANLQRSPRGSVFGGLSDRSLLSQIAVLLVTLGIFLFGFSLLGPNMNVYLYEALHLSRTLVGVLTFLGGGVTMVLQPFIGSWSDSIGRKPFLILSAATLALGNFTLFIATDFPLALLSQILIRNYSAFLVIASAYIADVVPAEKKSTALGLQNSIGGLSRSIGAIVGGLIITFIDIQTVILVSILFPIAGNIGILFFLEESRT
jgi:DHA1 family multidrug resistance protein-like MFS transporter